MKLKQKINYFLDNFATKGTGNLMLALFIVTMMVVLVLAFLASVFDGFQQGPIYYIWAFINHTIDVGNLYGVEMERGFAYIFVATISTFVGILILSLVISFVSSGFERKLKTLSKGRGKVVEEGHTLIIGFDKSVPIMVEELIIANENVKRGVVVILSKDLPEKIFAHLDQTIKDYKNTKVIVRSGSNQIVEDLNMCAIGEARSVIIVSNNDIETIKTLITINQSDFKNNTKAHITTEIHNEKNVSVARKIVPNKIETIYVQDLKARIFARTCLQPGSSMVYKDLFSFDGSEIYFEPLERGLEVLVGKSFSEAVLSLNNGYLIGISRDGKQLVNPPANTTILANDELIVIAEDDSQLVYQDNSKLNLNLAAKAKDETVHTLNLLMIGYNNSLLKILDEIDAYNLNKQALTIMVQSQHDMDEILRLKPKTTFTDYKIIIGHGKERADLEKIKLEAFDVVCIFANNANSKASDQDLDADTLLTILHLHDLEEQRNIKLNFVTEILNESNVSIIQSINVDDFMVSNLLLSRIITQVSENARTNDVIVDLVSEDGSELYLKYADDYVPLNKEINCYTLLAEANKRQHLFIGYKLYKQPPVLNPKLDTLIKFGPKDSIIVVSED
jgi:Trk K+ transport system NAD-binding subunit